MTYSYNKFEVIQKHPLGLFCSYFILATINTLVKRIDFGARQIRIKFWLLYVTLIRLLHF